MSQYVVITGMSGAGRTEVSRNLEDLGWFVIDNLPPALISKVGELASAPGSTFDKIALAVGTGRYDGEIVPALAALRAHGDRVQVIFLEASTETLVRRYESTRRRHPFAPDRSVSDAIETERTALAPLKEEADVVVDTSDLNVHQLRERVQAIFGGDAHQSRLRVHVNSFGFKHGVPIDVDCVFDCRFLPNPHWIDDLRPQTGLDAAVVQFVLGQSVTKPFLVELERLYSLLIPLYVREGKSYLTVAFGCTGGRHRSVVMAEQFAAILRRQGLDPNVTHRDIEK
jgi:RNase adapter protein RapZ